MTRAPEPIRTFRGSVAPAVETIVLRCLEKHPADRWQTTAELVAQLEPLATPSGGMTPTQTRPIDAVAPVRTRRFSVILGGAALIGVAAAVVYALTRPPPPLSVGRRTQVTLTEGIEERPIISADGKSVAYGAVDPNDGSVRLEMRRVEGGSAVRLAAGAFPLGWSPGGDQILIATQRGLEIIPALGGTGKLIAVRSRSGAWSPDGKSIVFVQGDSLLARPIGPGEPRLVTRTLDPHSPAWSPDGKWIAFVSGNSVYLKDWNIATSSLWLAPASGGAAVPLTTVTALHLSPIWTPDSRRILFVSDRDRGRDVYELSLAAAGRPRGEPIRLTTGLDASSISLSADGRYLAYSVAKNRSNVGSVPVPSVGWVSSRIAQSVTSGDQNVESFDISRDGRWLVFDSDRSGLQQLFRMPLGGGEVEQITDDSLPGFSPSLSGDGKELAFHSISRDGLRRVFIKPVEGGRAVQVSPGAARDERAPYLSPEGSRILWEVPDIHGEQMATRGADGRWSGPKLVAGSGIAPAWSPDGTRFVAIDTLGNFAVNSVAGGPSSILVSASDARDLGRASWSSDGATLYLLWYKNQSLRVYAMPATGGTPREVVRFDDPSHPFVKFGFMEHAGRLYFTVGDQQSDIWVVELKGAEK